MAKALSAFQKKALAHITEMTNAYWDPKSVKHRTGKATEVAAFLTANKEAFGSYRGQIVKLLSILVGEHVKTSAPGNGVIVVPTKNTNSHNYVIGEPTMLRGGMEYALRMSGTVGNSLGEDHKKASGLRAPTPAEIRHFVQGVPEAALKSRLRF